ncbi:hypothetical protein DOT_5481 [Desulfosporosinus sp. OT]|nr:hypothetical protein DOT_5481 [Desulfosporosinus sp. OT]
MFYNMDTNSSLAIELKIESISSLSACKVLICNPKKGGLNACVFHSKTEPFLLNSSDYIEALLVT